MPEFCRDKDCSVTDCLIREKIIKLFGENRGVTYFETNQDLVTAGTGCKYDNQATLSQDLKPDKDVLKTIIPKPRIRR